MQRLKKWTMIVFAVILATAFVQSAGGYIAAQLNSLGLEEHQADLHIEEKVLKYHRREGSRPSPWKRDAEKQNGCLARPYK